MKAERVTVSDEAEFELVAKVQESRVFFEVRERGSLKFITLTDESDYRAPHASDDGKLVLASMTIVLIPIAIALRDPTTQADRVRAWTTKTRRLIHEAVVGKASFFGATEARGTRWIVRFGTPTVLRHPVLEELEVLSKDDDFQPVDASSDDAHEATFSASLVLPELTRLLDETSGLVIGDGKATLVLQLVNGSFRPSLGLRGNLALSRSMSSKQSLIPPRAPAIPLPGATRLLIPITITAGASRTK